MEQIRITGKTERIETEYVGVRFDKNGNLVGKNGK